MTIRVELKSLILSEHKYYVFMCFYLQHCDHSGPIQGSVQCDTQFRTSLRKSTTLTSTGIQIQQDFP